MSPTPSTPLVPKAPSAPTPTPLSRTTARLAGTARILFGAACILAPTLTTRLFSLPSPPVAVLLLGFSGARDLVLGELLLFADKDQGAGGRAGARRVLWGIAAVDALDLCIACVAVAKGEMGWEGFTWLSALAVSGIGLVGGALWGY